MMSHGQRKVLWSLCALLLLNFALRTLQIDAAELRGDEAFSYLITRQPAAQIVEAVVAQGDPHPPLHYLSLRFWTNQFGTSELSMRYIAVLLTLPWLALLFIFAQRLYGMRFGLLVAGLAAMFQSIVRTGQDVRNQYMLVVLVSTLATLTLWRIGQSADARRRDWALYAGCVLLLLYAHYYTVFVLFAHGVFILLPRHQRHIRSYALANLAALLLFSPWLAVTWQIVQRQPYQQPTPLPFFPYLYDLFGWLLAGSASDINTLRWPLLGLLFFVGIGTVTLYQRERDLTVLLVVWLFMGSLGMYGMLLVRALFNPYHAVILALPFFLFLASGIWALWEKKRPLYQAMAGVGLMLVVTSALFPLMLNFALPYRFGGATGMRDLVPYLAQRIAPGDVLLAHFPDPAVDYYFGDLPLARTLLPARWGAPKGETETTLAQLARTHPRIWLLPQYRSQWDPENVVPIWLEYNTLLEQYRAVAKFELLAYRPPHAALRNTRLLERTLYEAGNEILRLSSVHVTINGRIVATDETAVRVMNGDLLQASLVWTAVAPTSTDYTVFVHLLNAEGALVAQQDGAPTFGANRTSFWQPGDIIIDRRDFPITALPPGSYQLNMGMYDASTIERQLFEGSEFAWQLTLEVVE